MRFAGMVVLLVGLAAVAVGAQQVSMRKSDGYSWTTAVSDGRTITVVIHEASGDDPNDKLSNIRREYKAPISQLDFSVSRVDATPPFAPHIAFQCKPGPGCWVIRRLFPYEDPVGEPSNFEPMPMRMVWCEPVATCQDFLDRANPQRGTAAPTTDCDALRSTYFPPGQRPTLPAECLTDADRATIYQPVRPGPPPSPAPQPETVIDGSKIPSRIDFAPPPKSAPAPVAPPPPPAPEPPAAPTPEISRTPVAPVPARVEVPSFQPDDSAQPETERPRSRFASLFDGVARRVEETGAGIVGEEMRRALDPTSKRLSWTRYAVRDFVIEKVKQFTTDYVMNLRFPDLPAFLRADADLIQAGYASSFQGLNLKAGYKLVNRFFDLFGVSGFESTEK